MESKQSTCLPRGSSSDTEVIKKIDKIPRTPPRPPRNKPNGKDNVSNVSKTGSTFRNRRSDSISSQKSNSSHRSENATQKKRKKDSTSSMESEVSTQATDGKDTIQCPVCGDDFDEDDSCISCSCCQRWFHAICQDLSEEDISAFNHLGSKASFFCHNCNAGAKELYNASVVLKERLDQVDQDVKTVKSNVKTNTTKIKTLETIHANLRKDVDTTTSDMKSAKTNIKTLQDNYESDKSDKAEIKTRLKANKQTLTDINTKLRTIEGDIVKKLEPIIKSTIDEKIKSMNHETPVNPNLIADLNLNDAINQQINEKLQNEKDELHETINKKINERVITTYNESNPNLPIAEMEVDGERPSKIKVPATFATAVQQVSSEMQEIQKRKLQLVMTNVRETGTNDKDLKAAKEIFGLMNVNVNIVEVMRLGKTSNEKPRILRVSLENLNDKRTVLAKATSLRNVPSDHKHAYVYIKPNLTPTQQETQKNLYLQLLSVRKKNPNTVYKISKGKIIVVPPQPQA